MGSAPGDSTKIIGVVLVESSNDPRKSNNGDIVKDWSKVSVTKCLTKVINFSSFILLKNKSF